MPEDELLSPKTYPKREDTQSTESAEKSAALKLTDVIINELNPECAEFVPIKFAEEENKTAWTKQQQKNKNEIIILVFLISSILLLRFFYILSRSVRCFSFTYTFITIFYRPNIDQKARAGLTKNFEEKVDKASRC